MAINGRFRVSMADVFPAGAFVVGEVEGAWAMKAPAKGTKASSDPVAGAEGKAA
ncbi:MAG: hypothetical protein ACRDTE_31080 [Pseudonocardiaceae bacterium]